MKSPLSKSLPIPPPSTPPPSNKKFLANQTSGFNNNLQSSPSPRKSTVKASSFNREMLTDDLMKVREQQDLWAVESEGGSPRVAKGKGKSRLDKLPLEPMEPTGQQRQQQHDAQRQKQQQQQHHQQQRVEEEDQHNQQQRPAHHHLNHHNHSPKFASVNSLDAWPGRSENFKPKLLKQLERYISSELLKYVGRASEP